MVEASIHMCLCEIIVGVVLATQMDPVTGGLSQAATIGLIVVVGGTTLLHTTLTHHTHTILACCSTPTQWTARLGRCTSCNSRSCV